MFYSAFIIRKLIDCKSKLSDEADKYAIKVKVYKAKKQFDIYNRYIDEDSHEYDTCLLAFMILDQAERKNKISELKKKINP